MYALLQSKNPRRAETVYRFPRLFGSAVAANASFITALALSSSAGFYSQLPGFSPGAAWAVLLSSVLLGVGNTPVQESQEGCCGLEKGQSHPPRMIISGDLPSGLCYESRAAHDKPGLCTTHKDTLPHKLKTHKFAMMKTCV